MSTFSVESYHLNVDSGDSAIHVLVERSLADPTTILSTRFVLVDGGYEPYGDFWIRKVCTSFKKHFNQPSGIKFDGIVVTHWDGDHYEGINALFKVDLQQQWAVKAIALQPADDKSAKWEEFVKTEWLPAFCKTTAEGGTHMYVPYFTDKVKIDGETYTSTFKSNTKAVFGENVISGQPPSWNVLPIKTQPAGPVMEYLLLNMKNPYDVKKNARSKPLVQVHYTSDTLLAYDFFRGVKAPLEQAMEWKKITDPSIVSKKLTGTQPVMFCVLADCVVCGREPPKKESDFDGGFKWDLTDYANPMLVKKTQADLPKLVPGSTTIVNQASIACMIIWPNKTKAVISHYFGGDLGDEVEGMVVQWSTVPQSAQTPNQRKRTPVYATKLSHHGAKQSTPKELFMAFQPKRMVVSNGMSKEWKHPKISILVFMYAWKLFMEANAGSATIQLNPVFDFRALNFPVYLGWCYDTQKNLVPINPGAVKEFKKEDFRQLVCKIAAKDKKWFDDNFGLITDGDATIQQNVVAFLKANWQAIGTKLAKDYIGGSVADLSPTIKRQGSGNFSALSRAGWQAIRAVLIVQTADDVQMKDLTLQDLELHYTFTDIPEPVERKRDKKTKEITLKRPPSRERRRPQRYEPEIVKVEKKKRGLKAKLKSKEKQKKQILDRLLDLGARGMQKKVVGPSETPTIQLPQADITTVAVEKSVGISSEEQYYFVAPGTPLDPSIQPASIATEATGLADFLPYLEVPALVLSKKPLPDTKTPIDSSDRLYQWLALLFKSGDTFSFLATATTTAITALEFEMSLEATITGPVSGTALKNVVLSSLLSFSTNYRDLALVSPPPVLIPQPPVGAAPTKSDITLHQMLILGLDPRANGQEFTFGTICQFLECNLKLLSVLKGITFKLDAATDKATRNAVWVFPDTYYTTIMRLQFIVSPIESKLDWLHKVLHDINPVSKLSFPSPVRLVAKKQFRSQLPELDTYNVERSWELILTADVSITNNKNVTRVVEIVLAFTPTQTSWTLFLTPPNSKESNDQQDSLDAIIEFLLGFLPSSVNVPSVESLNNYLPFSDHIFLRSLSVMRNDDGTTNYEINFEVVIASVTFFATLKLGQSPSFYAEIFQDLSKPWAEDLYQEFPYSPTWESYLIISPQNKEHESSQTSMDLSKLHSVLTEGSEVSLNELSKQQLGSKDMYASPIGLELMSASVTVDKSGFSFQGSMMNVSDDPPGNTGTFPELDIGMAYLVLDYQTTGKALNMTAGINMDLVSRNDHVASNVTICAQVSYTQGDWTVAASVGPLTFSHLWDFFNTDCSDEILNILEQISIPWLSLEYSYHKGGDKSLSIGGELAIGPVALDFNYNNHSATDWSFLADLNINSPTAGISFLDLIMSFCGPAVEDELPDFLKTPNISLMKVGSGGSASDLVSLRLHRLDTHFVISLQMKLTASISILFMHLQKKRDPTTSGNTEPNFPPLSKRLLLVKVDGLLATVSNIPFVSTMLQPFDEMDFLWVDGANDKGFTSGEVALVNGCLAGTHFSISYKAPVQPQKAGNSTEGIVLASGCHFIIIWSSEVIIDSCFGQQAEQEITLDDAQNPLGDTTNMVSIDKTIGPLTVSQLGLQVDTKELRVITNAQISMGGFSAGAIGLTMHVGLQNISFQDLSGAKISLSVRGISLGLDAPPVSLAGILVDQLDATKISYAGGAIVGLKTYSLIGFGSYTKSAKTNSPSFFAVAQLNGPLCAIGPVQITGVKIGFGCHTQLRSPDLTTVYHFPFCVSWTDASSPMDLMDEFISWFSESPDYTWVALGLEAQLQDCLSIIAAVVLDTSPKVTLHVYGQGTMRMPAQAAEDKCYVNIQLGLISTIDFEAGSMLTEASLAPASFIVNPACQLSGSFAIASWWSPSPVAGDWVITIGGYHPQYKPRPHYPLADRLSINWQVSDTISIYGSAYLAMTPDVLMAGATLYVTFSWWDIHAAFAAYADFLVNYAPFAFQADVGVMVEGSLTLGIGCLSHTFTARVSASVHLQGPPVHGVTAINMLSHSFCVPFGNAQALEDGGLEFGKFCNLLMSKSQKKDYHIVSLESGALAPLSDKENAGVQDTTAWNVRGATFGFGLQTLIPMSTASVNSKPSAQSTEPNVYAKPMQLRKGTGLKTNLEVSIKDRDDAMKSEWKVHYVEQWLPSNIWGAYYESTDPMRSGNDIGSLLQPGDNPGIKCLTSLSIIPARPKDPTDSLGPFDPKSAFDHSIIGPHLATQPHQLSGLPAPLPSPSEESGKKQPSRPRLRTGLGFSNDSNDDKTEPPQQAPSAPQEFWTTSGELRKKVATAMADVFGWMNAPAVASSTQTMNELFVQQADQTPQLLLKEYDFVYFEPPRMVKVT